MNEGKAKIMRAKNGIFKCIKGRVYPIFWNEGCFVKLLSRVRLSNCDQHSLTCCWHWHLMLPKHTISHLRPTQFNSLYTWSQQSNSINHLIMSGITHLVAIRYGLQLKKYRCNFNMQLQNGVIFQQPPFLTSMLNFQRSIIVNLIATNTLWQSILTPPIATITV